MHCNKVINALNELGKVIVLFIESNEIKQKDFFPELFFARLESQRLNTWFVSCFIDCALKNIRKWLFSENLNYWLSKNRVNFNDIPKNIGIIMPGNIPLVGFHDFLSVILSGNRVIIKLSSKDSFLLPALTSYIIKIYPEMSDYIFFTDTVPENVDAVIATGSDNTIRSLKYFYKNKTSLFRGTRNSVAILSGNETDEQLSALADDIFLYFGLGCRSVSKIYLPDNKNIFERLKTAFQKYNWILKHKDWNDNLKLQKAKLLTHRSSFIDYNSIIFIQNSSINSPVATINYEIYDSVDNVLNSLKVNESSIQCIVGSKEIDRSLIDFGCSQSPNLNDFADGINVLRFLSEL